MMSESSNNTKAYDDNNERAESPEERKNKLEKIMRDIKGSLDRLVDTGETNTKKEEEILKIIHDSHKITSKSNPNREDIKIAEMILNKLHEMEEIEKNAFELRPLNDEDGLNREKSLGDHHNSGENFTSIITTPASETNSNISESERMGLYDIYAKLMLHERGNLRIDPDVKKKQQDISIHNAEKTGYGENLIKENSEKYDKIISTVKAKLKMVVQDGWKYVKKGWNTSTEWTRETVVKYPMSMGLGVAFVASSVRLALAKVGVTFLPDYLVLPIVQGSNFYPDAVSALLRLGAAAASPVLALSIARFFSGKLKGWKEQTKNIGAAIVPSALFSGLPYVYANSFSLGSMLGIVALPATAYVIFDQLRKWKNWDEVTEETVAQASSAARATASPSTSAESETTDEGGAEFPALEKSLKEAFKKHWKKKKEENAELKDPQDQAGWFAQLAKFLNSAEGKQALEEAKLGDAALRDAAVEKMDGEKTTAVAATERANADATDEKEDNRDDEDIKNDIKKNEEKKVQLNATWDNIEKAEDIKEEIAELTNEQLSPALAVLDENNPTSVISAMATLNRAKILHLLRKFERVKPEGLIEKVREKIAKPGKAKDNIWRELQKRLIEVEREIKGKNDELRKLEREIGRKYKPDATSEMIREEIAELDAVIKKDKNILTRRKKEGKKLRTIEEAMNAIMTEQKKNEIVKNIAKALAKDHAPKTWKETTMAKLGNIGKEVKTHPFKTIRSAETQYPKATVAAGVALSMLPIVQGVGIGYLLYRGGRYLIENGKKPSVQPKTAQKKSPTATEGEEKK